MKRYLFIRELPLPNFIALQDYLNSIFPEIEIQSITYNSVKNDDVQEHEVILETKNNIDDNLYINIGLLIDTFESEILTMDSLDVIEIQNEIEIIDKVNIYKSLNNNDKEQLLATIETIKSKNLDILEDNVNF